VLYVSYDGLLEPLGESQVVSYVERLANRAAITVLSFEKPLDLADTARMAAMRRRLSSAGVAWIAESYHKRPPVFSTAYDVMRGCWHARRWAREDSGPALVHARGYVPSLIALDAKRSRGARFVFDMRGFWIDEKVEAEHWPRGGLLHRAGKWWERRFFAGADAVVSLTHAGVREFGSLGRLRPQVPVEVITTCTDLDRFRPGAPDAALRASLGLDGAVVIGYAGTLSNWYLRQETLAYLARLLQAFPSARVLCVTREDHDRLRADAVQAGVPADRLVLRRASFDQMPALLRLMQLGVFFIKPCFSKRASAATKLGEFLACGVPVVINDGIGDSGAIVRQGCVGVVLAEANAAQYDASLPEVARVLADPEMPARCRAVAEREFSLDRGVERYAALYERIS
jgi:glycosyltransferase involved in cell wall biosynthesis